MAVLNLSFLFSNHHFLCVRNFIPTQNPHAFLFCSSLSAASSPSRIAPDLKSIALGRRLLLKLSIHVPVLLWNPFSNSLSMATNEVLSLERYSDSKEGFTLLRPSSWIQVDKAGAAVLFEDANKRSNNLGVVVTPVRITSLGEFGSPEFVAGKLIEAERRK